MEFRIALALRIVLVAVLAAALAVGAREILAAKLRVADAGAANIFTASSALP
jgi:hypothetical protein